MGNIQRRPTGVWRARYRDADGRERSKHFDRRVDAVMWLAQAEAGLAAVPTYSGALDADIRRRADAVGSSREVLRTVYYARLWHPEHGEMVKIGVAGDVAQRLSQLWPAELLATEPGGAAVERARHRDFADLRIRFEWFRYEGALLAHVARLQGSDPSDPAGTLAP